MARIIRILKVLRLIKLLRLARVMRLPHIMQRLEAVVGRVLLQLFTMAGSMILLLHWAACIWYYVAVLSEGNSWVMHEDMKDARHDEIYITALYWSVTTIATVGYGEHEHQAISLLHEHDTVKCSMALSTALKPAKQLCSIGACLGS